MGAYGVNGVGGGAWPPRPPIITPLPRLVFVSSLFIPISALISKCAAVGTFTSSVCLGEVNVSERADGVVCGHTPTTCPTHMHFFFKLLFIIIIILYPLWVGAGAEMRTQYLPAH